MRKNNLLTFTFIVYFRGGIYCSQVEAKNISASTIAWFEEIKSTKKDIKYLGDKILKELQIAINDEDDQPTLLQGLKNAWFNLYLTSQGSFLVNIVQTDTN